MQNALFWKIISSFAWLHDGDGAENEMLLLSLAMQNVMLLGCLDGYTAAEQMRREIDPCHSHVSYPAKT